MSVQIIECERHVVQVEMTPDDPGYINRTLKLSLLSGPPLTDEQWGRVQEAVVRQLIGAGCRVHRVTPARDIPPE
ncbi:MAG TPA: hypothetical protein VGE74_13045 [Gemmata sp.]